MMKRSTMFANALAAALATVLVGASAASAHSESFSGNTPNNGYIQNPHHAHSFRSMSGDTGQVIQLACQLFNYQGSNSVTHGTGQCSLSILPPVPYQYARVYNQSGFTSAFLTGFATT